MHEGWITLAHQHHRLDFMELPVTDMERAKSFYRDAFGWEYNHYGPAYAGIRSNPEENMPEIGGFLLAEEVVTGGPLLILYSDDLEVSEKAVVAAGGTITKPTYDFPGGQRFQFRDTEGNVLAIWTVVE